jgi:ferrochelatase
LENLILDKDKAHAVSQKVGILLINLGTPDAPTAKAVRPYLKQFLSDSRVVEVPKFIWWFILNGIILPFRSSASAKKYASVWMDQANGSGAPLFVHSNNQSIRLQQKLASNESTKDVKVALAMRYGNPSIEKVMNELENEGVNRLLVLPLYPQYSATTTASSFDAVFEVHSKKRNPPALRMVKNYHDHPAYIASLVKQVQDYWGVHGTPDFKNGDKFVMSFHGVPKRTLLRGDPYHCECHKTGRLLREALGLSSEEAILSFQSRFGKAEWLKPYTAPLLELLGKAKTNRLDIFCPGFPADCLETLEEIAMEGKEIFTHAGGQAYNVIPCLNDQETWLDGLHTIALENIAGWQTKVPSASEITNRIAMGQAAEKIMLAP